MGFEKPLDKSSKVCYNLIKVGGAMATPNTKMK
jgi:hypothetical protein